MNATAPAVRATHAEYLARERDALARHEFLDGVIYAMAGGTIEHSLLAANAIRLLGTMLLDRPCLVFTSDLRVQVAATGLTTYPDVSVVCGPVERAPDDPHAIANPVLLVEVLSDGTEAYDRGEKFAHYRRLPSLREYVLVSQRERRLEAFRRDDAGAWVLAEAGAGETLALATLGGALEVDAVYRGVALGAARAG